MKKSDLKDFSFFQNKDGSYDNLAMSLNCFESSVYNVIKNIKSYEKDIIFPLFLRDINPTLWFNNTTGVFRITYQSRNITPLWRKYVILNRDVRKRDENSVKFLESLLDKGQMVIIQTVFGKIPFLSWYDPQYDLSIFNEGEEHHANIIVYHEDDKIYYVEKIPYNIHKENFVPYEFNKQVGVALKSEIEEACNFFLRCYTLNVNEHELKRADLLHKDIVELIHAIANNFTGSIEQVDGYTRCYGTAALEKLIEFCDEGVDLNKYFLATGWKLQDRIPFDIWMLSSSRLILLEYLKLINTMESSERYKNIMETLQEAITQWETLERGIFKLIKSNPPCLNPKIGKRVNDIMDVENRLNVLLRNFS